VDRCGGDFAAFTACSQVEISLDKGLNAGTGA
jgi:hypothetical protein